MRKIFLGLAIIAALFLVSQTAFAKVDRVPGPWDFRGTYVITFTCTSGCVGDYIHTMNITSMDFTTGNFSGTGYYNDDPSYTWDVNGTVTGSNFAFHVVYTGKNAGYTLDASGTIDSNGALCCFASSSTGQTFNWMADGLATRFTGNHGQYVSSETNKLDAALSSIGMPINSNK